MDLELLLAVQDAGDVRAQLAQQRAGVRALVAESGRERRRRDDVPPLGGHADAIVEVEQVEVADGARELPDLAALHGEGVRRELLAQHARVDLERHHACPLFIARSRNLARSGMTKRSCRPSAILSFASHASTEKRKRRPSVSSSVALARAVMPTGVAARCRISTMVPTVVAAGARCGLIIAPHTSSSMPISHGVAKTLTPRLPIASAVLSSVTVQVISWVAPGLRSMACHHTSRDSLDRGGRRRRHLARLAHLRSRSRHVRTLLQAHRTT